MITRTRSLLSLAALALLTTSCLNDPADPTVTPECLTCLNTGPIAFEAVSANDHPLPAYINADGSSQSGDELMRASILLVAPDSLRLILTTRHMAENGEAGAEVGDTLRAHYRLQDSTIVLSRMGTNPLLLQEQGTIRSNLSMVLTVEQPLPSSEGPVGTHPVELVFQLVRRT